MSKKGFGKFVIGAAIGTGLGLIFAPKKGSETRKELKEKFVELASNLKEIDPDDVKTLIENKIDEIKEELEDLDKEKVLKIAKQKAKSVKKKSEELVDLAVQKGSPILEKTANEVREKTISVIKEVLAKLEEK